MTLLRWSGFAYGDYSVGGTCFLGSAVGLTASTLSWPRRILQRASRFAWHLVSRTVGGRVCARSETIDHVSLSRQFYEPSVDVSPGISEFEARESLFSRL